MLSKLIAAVAFVLSANKPVHLAVVPPPAQAAQDVSSEIATAEAAGVKTGCTQIVYVWDGRIRTCAAYGPINP